MSYRIARSLAVLRDQCNQAWPGRSTVSDGWIGDPSHSSRDSDHNPDPNGIVRAIDITHDPGSGADMTELAQSLIASRDPRIKYIIWNRHIISPTVSPWTWRAYTGTNPHDHHLHLSVVPDGRADSPTPWQLPVRKEWDEMASKQEIKDAVREVVKEELRDARQLLAVGSEQPYDAKKVNLKAAIDKK